MLSPANFIDIRIHRISVHGIVKPKKYTENLNCHKKINEIENITYRLPLNLKLTAVGRWLWELRISCP